MSACAACRSFKAETEGLCWICAHHVAVHNATHEQALTAECECLPCQIYPFHVMTSRPWWTLDTHEKRLAEI